MPLCLICDTDYEPIGTGHPPYPCDCGANLGRHYRRDYEPGEIASKRRAWQQQTTDHASEAEREKLS